MRIAPVNYVESGAADAVGIPSAEPLAAVARGGAVSHRVVRGRGPAGQGHCCPPVHDAEKSFALAQAFPGAGRSGVAARRATARSQAQDKRPSDAARRDHDHAATADRRHALEHAHHGGCGRHQRGQRAPHLARPWIETASRGNLKISNDPAFAEKLEDIVGLYLNPPEHAPGLCVDEKSQIQALDRTHPCPPFRRERGATMTNTYKRNATANT